MKRRHPAFYATVGTLVLLAWLLIVGTSGTGLLAAVILMPVILWTVGSSHDAGRPVPRWLTIPLGAIGLALFSYRFATLGEYSIVAVIPWLGVIGFAIACLWLGFGTGRSRRNAG